MRATNKLLKWALFVVIVLMLATSLAFLFYFIFRNSNPTADTQESNVSAMLIKNMMALREQKQTKTDISIGVPVRLKIPKINVDATIEFVGLTSDGAMDVPKDRGNVAWFELGQRPGENGSAVIAGHYGWKNKRGSAFDDLHKLRKGDELFIEDDNGVIISFVVREIRRYNPKADASFVFGSGDGDAHLNLVTCEGVWDEASNSYPERLVVFTDKN